MVKAGWDQHISIKTALPLVDVFEQIQVHREESLEAVALQRSRKLNHWGNHCAAESVRDRLGTHAVKMRGVLFMVRLCLIH